MGLLEIVGNMIKRPPDAGKAQSQKCPNCGETVNLAMERCPKCGVRIKSMFRRKCPRCGTLSELGIRKCGNCFYDYEAELEMAKKTYYVCPICGYRMSAYLTQCPACNRRFV